MLVNNSQFYFDRANYHERHRINLNEMKVVVARVFQGTQFIERRPCIAYTNTRLDN